MNNNSNFIWPWWVRLSHWLVAAGVSSLWLMSHVWYETDALHRGVGYAVMAIVAGRILAGTLTKHQSARFHVPGWQVIRTHLAQVWQARQGQATPSAHRGHNPLGQWAVYAIWSLILLLALTGWLSRTDAFWGEDWPVELHALFSWALFAIIVVHVLAVIWIGRLSRQSLVRQMWHGRFDTRK